MQDKDKNEETLQFLQEGELNRILVSGLANSFTDHQL